MIDSSTSVGRSLAPTRSSSSIGTPGDSSASDTGSAEASTPAGRFDAGLRTSAPTTTGARATVALVASPATVPSTGEAGRDLHPCPEPVRTLILSAGLVIGGVGLSCTIYGGMKLMDAVDPVFDAERGKHAGIMISGMIELVAGLVLGMLARDTPPTANLAANPA